MDLVLTLLGQKIGTLKGGALLVRYFPLMTAIFTLESKGTLFAA